MINKELQTQYIKNNFDISKANYSKPNQANFKSNVYGMGQLSKSLLTTDQFSKSTQPKFGMHRREAFIGLAGLAGWCLLPSCNKNSHIPEKPINGVAQKTLFRPNGTTQVGLELDADLLLTQEEVAANSFLVAPVFNPAAGKDYETTITSLEEKPKQFFQKLFEEKSPVTGTHNNSNDGIPCVNGAVVKPNSIELSYAEGTNLPIINFDVNMPLPDDSYLVIGNKVINIDNYRTSGSLPTPKEAAERMKWTANKPEGAAAFGVETFGGRQPLTSDWKFKDPGTLPGTESSPENRTDIANVISEVRENLLKRDIDVLTKNSRFSRRDLLNIYDNYLENNPNTPPYLVYGVLGVAGLTNVSSNHSSGDEAIADWLIGDNATGQPYIIEYSNDILNNGNFDIVYDANTGRYKSRVSTSFKFEDALLMANGVIHEPHHAGGKKSDFADGEKPRIIPNLRGLLVEDIASANGIAALSQQVARFPHLRGTGLTKIKVHHNNEIAIMNSGSTLNDSGIVEKPIYKPEAIPQNKLNNTDKSFIEYNHRNYYKHITEEDQLENQTTPTNETNPDNIQDGVLALRSNLVGMNPIYTGISTLVPFYRNNTANFGDAALNKVDESLKHIYTPDFKFNIAKQTNAFNGYTVALPDSV